MDITALLLAAVAAFAVGMVWYTVLFGKAWRRLMNVPEGAKMSAMGTTFVAGFVIELVRAYVMLKIVAAMGAFSVSTGLEAGFWVWLGFTATVGLTQVVYEKKGWKYFAISYGYHLAALLVMGAILATW